VRDLYHPAMKFKFLLLFYVISMAAFAQDDGRTYKTGYPSIMKLGRDIHNALKPQYKEMISPQPISIETEDSPSVRVASFPDEPKPLRGVWISAGFIDLVNNVAHAKAIDRKEKGYLAKYIDLLAQESGARMLKPLPNDGNPKYWTDEMLNEQQSNFNSIVGIVVGIKLAHHYLGQYDKYKPRLAENSEHPVAINTLLTQEEWEQAFRVGLRNALEAGCMIEGVVPFFEAFDKMKVRPPWSIYFLPDNVKFGKLKKEMEKIQRRFLNGEE
jgi:hypothetical protein